MKKAAFIFGYAGGILALIFSLLMIYTVPAGLISTTVEGIKSSLGNENVLAYNEMALAVGHGAVIKDYSEEGLKQFAEGVAKDSKVITKKSVYDDTAEFLYGKAWGAIISLALVGVSIIFGILAFIGSLVLRKAPRGGGVLVLLSAFILLLSAIYTDTILPMAAASLLLTLGGIFVFIPQSKRPVKNAVKPRPQFAPYGAQYPQMQYQPQYNPYQYPQQPQQGQAEGTQVVVADAGPRANVPFPEEEPGAAQPQDAERIKE